MSNGLIAIRKMQTKDLHNAVEIHLDSFQGFFLSFLGPIFLNELYSGILSDPSGIAFVAEKDGQMQGFIAGTDNPQGFYKGLLRRRWARFALASIWPVIKNPDILPRLFRSFSRGQQVDVRENCANLMSVAVSPQAQGRGIGKMLVNTFLDDAYNRGKTRVNLTTDKNNNSSANFFYKNIGFSLVSSFETPEGREMNEYIIDLEIQ